MVAQGAAWLLGGSWGGMRGCSRGGMHGCSQGGMHGCSQGGCAWLLPRGGMHGCSGGVCGCCWGHAFDTMRYRDTISERAVRILLECILVLHCVHSNIQHFSFRLRPLFVKSVRRLNFVSRALFIFKALSHQLTPSPILPTTVPAKKIKVIAHKCYGDGDGVYVQLAAKFKANNLRFPHQ